MSSLFLDDWFWAWNLYLALLVNVNKYTLLSLFMVLTRKQNISFYKNKKKVAEVIIDNVKKKKHIIFGARSLNAHFPSFLDKQTRDYDIIIEKGSPKKVATRLEKKLDKRFKGNFYFVEKARHGGTYKVKTRLGKEGIIDISKSKSKVPTDKIKGIRYSKLIFEKQKIRESLNDPQSKFRHDKDRERLERIRIFELLKKKRKTTKPRKRFASTGRLPGRKKLRINPGKASFSLNFKVNPTPNF